MQRSGIDKCLVYDNKLKKKGLASDIIVGILFTENEKKNEGLVNKTDNKIENPYGMSEF